MDDGMESARVSDRPQTHESAYANTGLVLNQPYDVLPATTQKQTEGYDLLPAGGGGQMARAGYDTLPNRNAQQPTSEYANADVVEEVLG